MYWHGCWLTSKSIPTVMIHADMLQIKRSPIRFWWLCVRVVIPLTLIDQMSTVPHPIAPGIMILSEVFKPFKPGIAGIRFISGPDPSLSLSIFAFPSLIIIFQSKESEAAKSLIQEVFLICSCIKKVTVVERVYPRWHDYLRLHRIQHLMILHGLLSKYQSHCFLLQQLSHIMIDVTNPGVFSSPLLTVTTMMLSLKYQTSSCWSAQLTWG